MNTFYDRQKRKEGIAEIKKKSLNYVFDKSRKGVNKRYSKLSTVEIAGK